MYCNSNTVLPSRKSDQEISKSDFYQTIFLPQIRPKADPNSLFWGKNQTSSQNLIPTLGKSTFIWNYSIFKEIFKYFFYFCGRLKQWNLDLFNFFGQKKRLFRQKEDQFRSIFSKRSAIRPRSDKADLLGSTATAPQCSVWKLNVLNTLKRKYTINQAFVHLN